MVYGDNASFGFLTLYFCKVTQTFDRSRFSVRIPVNAPTEKIFESWTTRRGLESFFLREAGFRSVDGEDRGSMVPVQPGDTYTWRWWGYSDEIVEKGKVLEQNGTDLFRFSFGKAGDCTVKIYQLQGETIVELVQEDIPTDESALALYHIGCKCGWTFYFANLKSILEGGIDLRNRNENLGEVVSS